jgi:uncharacterized membrane protein YeiB
MGVLAIFACLGAVIPKQRSRIWRVLTVWGVAGGFLVYITASAHALQTPRRHSTNDQWKIHQLAQRSDLQFFSQHILIKSYQTVFTSWVSQSWVNISRVYSWFNRSSFPETKGCLFCRIVSLIACHLSVAGGSGQTCHGVACARY